MLKAGLSRWRVFWDCHLQSFSYGEQRDSGENALGVGSLGSVPGSGPPVGFAKFCGAGAVLGSLSFRLYVYSRVLLRLSYN